MDRAETTGLRRAPGQLTGLYCEEGVRFGDLKPGDLWTHARTPELLAAWTNRKWIELAVRGCEPEPLEPITTVTRVHLFNDARARRDH